MSSLSDMNKRLYYAGVGSREVPKHIANIQIEIAKKLASKGYILNTGDAQGSDSNFFTGCLEADGDAFVFGALNYMTSMGGDLTCHEYNAKTFQIAESIAKDTYENWSWLKTPYARRLMIRNTFQVLGANLNKAVSFLICYTEKGELKGGTRQAIKIATHRNIRVTNLGNSGDLEKTLNWLNL